MGRANAISTDKLADCRIRTLCPICNGVVQTVRIQGWRLHSNIVSARQKNRDRDEAVPGGGPEVLDDEVLRPFIADAELGRNDVSFS